MENLVLEILVFAQNITDPHLGQIIQSKLIKQISDIVSCGLN